MQHNWARLFNQLFEIINAEGPTYFSGPRFIAKVREIDPYFSDYRQYIDSRNAEGKSTSRKSYFYDILMSLAEQQRRELFASVLREIESHEPEKCRTIGQALGLTSIASTAQPVPLNQEVLKAIAPLAEAPTRYVPPDIEKFLAAIAPWQSAYKYSSFSFVALVDKERLIFVKARIHLLARPTSTRSSLNLPTVKFAETPIYTMGEALKLLVSAVLSGEPFPLGDYHPQFLLPSNTSVSAYHDHPQITSAWPDYVERLTISGESRWQFWQNRDHLLEKELFRQGYESMDDMLRDHGFKHLAASDSLDLEVIAGPVMRIGQLSSLRGCTLSIHVSVPSGVPRDDLSVIVLSEDHGPQLRRVIRSADFEWRDDSNESHGSATILLDRPCIVKCRAIYHGALHDLRSIADEAALPNIRRRVVELADPGLASLRQLLVEPRREQARDFEAAIQVFLYLLGFDSIRLAGVVKGTDSADVLAALPSETVLVVECSLWVLDPKDKLTKLIERVDSAKKELSYPSKAAQVLGLLVVAQPRGKLEHLSRIATRHQVLLLAKEDLVEGLDRTRLACRPDECLQGWRRDAGSQVSP